MILVLDGVICTTRAFKTTNGDAPAKGSFLMHPGRRAIVGPDAEFLTKVFSTKDTRGDDGSAST